jgi:hypothetical protein
MLLKMPLSVKQIMFKDLGLKLQYINTERANFRVEA